MHRIIIVGGGAGGIELATRLGNRFGTPCKHPKASITLVDRYLTHLWKPKLHEVASGSLDLSAHQLAYAAQARWHGFDFEQGALIGLDRKKKTITIAPVLEEEGSELLPKRILKYDILVLAIGSTTHFFNVPGAKEHSIALDTVEQAERFHRRFVAVCRRTQYSKIASQVSIAIVGGGATGVELAAELRNTAQVLAAYGLHRLDPKKDIHIVLIEAADRILPELSERVSRVTTQLLEKQGIEIRVREQVIEISDEVIATKSGQNIPAELKVWAAGIKAPDILKELEAFELNHRGQILVRPTLQSINDDDIFALGDCASGPWLGYEAKVVPPRAQAAHQQANFLVSAITRKIHNKPLYIFKYRDRGSLISLSHFSAVGNFMGALGKSVFIEGFFARLMYMALYRLHRVALHGWIHMILELLAHWLSRSTRPRVKLH
jgi:NADH dehydrogenase